MSNNERYRRFNLRIPVETFEALQRTADSRSHSMNAEIIQRLEESLSDKKAESSPEAQKVLDEKSTQLWMKKFFDLQKEFIRKELERHEAERMQRGTLLTGMIKEDKEPEKDQ